MLSIPRFTQLDVLRSYLTDASNLTGYCEALVRPRTTAQVAQVVAHCQRERIPLTVTAARTSTTGGPVPRGGWLLSVEHLTTIRHLTAHTAVAEAGVRLGDLQAAAATAGRYFPPDPTSRGECTLGGAIACNASGPRSFRYGPTRAWIAALEVVLPTGTVLQVGADDPIPADWPAIDWTPPNVKSAAGYCSSGRLIDLFIGQEGTLGVLTKATVRLTDPPTEVVGLLAWFPSRTTAVACMRAARQSVRRHPKGEVSPLSIEYLDQHCLRFARARDVVVPPQARAALLCEQPVEVDPDTHLEAWLNLLARCDALVDDTLVVTDAPGRRRFEALRHAVPAGINEHIVANNMPKVATDFAVPDHALDALLDAYEASPVPYALFGHLGDNHLHLNWLPRSAHELATAQSTYLALAKHVIRAGGTISAEHGIGKLKTDYFAMMVGQKTLDSFRALKRHLDPNWILGRGCLLTPPSQVS